MTSKGAVVQLTRAFAVEWTERGVRVERGSHRAGSTPPLSDRLATQASVTSDFIDGRMLTRGMLPPRDLVGAASLPLAGDGSGGVSGHAIAVDDGSLPA